MPSASIYREQRGDTVRFRVQYRLGGRESRVKHGGSFATRRLAEKRLDWIRGELANLRVPDLRLLDEQVTPTTLRAAAEAWRTSRVDVAAGTAQTHRVNLNRILRVLGDRPVGEIEPGEVAGLVSTLHAAGLKRESIRKTLTTLAMVFDHAERVPNPARDKRVKLPQEDRAEVNPPTAAHVLAVRRLLPTRYRLALLVLDATGMRVSELESLRWGDVDEPERRWRVSQASAKTKQARWVPVPEAVFAAVAELVPREDRTLERPVFVGFGADRFRTAITRACKAAGVPAFSPHDLRHRRASLWHLGGVPAAEAASWLGHSAQEHLRTYAHVVMDRTEIDYATCSDGDTPVTRKTPERAANVVAMR
jgi:integrase